MIPLPPLPYSYDALAPVISERTMRTHHDKHHAKYVATTIVLAEKAGLTGLSLEDLIRAAAGMSDRKLFNNAAQTWNHGFFWTSMAPHPSRPHGALAAAIQRTFGGVEPLKAAFVEAGAGHFGSGWVWLASEGGRPVVLSTHDADNLLNRNLTPLLVCDLWEHAYYLDYASDRAGFLDLWWERLANWDFAERQYAADAGKEAAWTYPTDAGLDGRIREAARKLRPDEDHHWSPAVGGDVRPHG